MVAATLANVHRDPRRKPKPYEPGDFFPPARRGRRQKRQSPEEMIRRLKRFKSKD